MDKKVLGKGLGALLSDRPDLSKLANASNQGAVKEIKIVQIKDNTLQPRENYDPERLEDLMSSIKEKGILQPIVVRKSGDGYEVVAGERRLRAARALNLEQIPVVIKNVDDNEALVLALVENIQREGLNPIEEARGFKRLIEEFGFTQDYVAQSVGKNRTTITNLLRLLKLPFDIQQAVFDDKISTGHARALLAIEDAYMQREVFGRILEKGLTVRDVEDLARHGASPAKSKVKKSSIKDREILLLEEELCQKLGTKVEVSTKKNNKGKVTIEYYSLDDLDRILEIIRK